MKKNIIIIFACLVLPTLLMARTNMHVYGYVYSPTREPEPFVTIQVVGTTLSTTTREDGYYNFSIPVTDTATIKYSYMGCEPFYLKIKNGKQSNIQRIVYLQESAILLNSAQVKAFSKQSGTQNTLDVSKINVIPDAAGGGIESLLSTYAGVSSHNEMSSQYSVRGGNYDENSVYVNNIEVYRPLLVRSGQQEGLSFINPNLVSDISFSAGGFEPKYGDKMSSVLDITYKKPKAFEASVSGSLLGASAYIGQASKDQKFTQVHGIRYKTSNYMLGTLDTKGVYDQKFIDYQTYITYHFAKKWEVDVLGNFSRNQYLSIPESETTTFGTLNSPTTFRIYFDGQEKDLFQTLFGATTLKFMPSNALTLNLIASAFSTREEVNYDISGQYWLGETTTNDDGSTSEGSTLGTGSYQDYARDKLTANVKSMTLRGDYAKKKNKLEWGVGIQQEKITDKINEFQLRDSDGYSLPYNSETLNMYYNLYSTTELNSYRTQGFIQDAFKIPTSIGNLSLIGGFRGNYWSFNKEMLISPRATVAFFPKWKKEFSFRFSTGVYYQSPFYKEMRDTVTDKQGNVTVELNHNIKAERSLHFVLGTDYYFKSYGRPFKLTTEIYYKPADRVISYTVDNVKILYSGQNDAKAYSAGIDFKLFGEIVPGTDSWISFSLLQSKEDVAGDNVGYVSRPNEQRYNFSMFFQDYFPGYPKYKVHLKFIYADGLPFWAPNVTVHTNNNTNRTTAYRRVDLGTSRSYVKGDIRWIDKTGVFKAVRSINLGLEVFNLLDISNVASYYWVTDIYKQQHAIPSYLTSRQINVKLSLDF
ncbi:MAG: carboxypeptidase-like regulatory domain-containing protein [Paludibacteraceae bacterium]|nr:carboxypeptidase-like regulatory domain-containing protein [Paludibacteraceae bacterium]